MAGAELEVMQIPEPECQPQVLEDVVTFMVLFSEQLTQLDSAHISNNTPQQRERRNLVEH